LAFLLRDFVDARRLALLTQKAQFAVEIRDGFFVGYVLHVLIVAHLVALLFALRGRRNQFSVVTLSWMQLKVEFTRGWQDDLTSVHHPIVVQTILIFYCMFDTTHRFAGIKACRTLTTRSQHFGGPRQIWCLGAAAVVS